MGSANRADKWTGWIKDRGVRAIAHYSLDKCGNCPRRLHCVERIMAYGNRMSVREAIEQARTCKHRAHKTTVVGRYVAEHVAKYCRGCDKSGVCIEEAQKHFNLNADMKPCLDCPDLANCVSGLLSDLRLGYPHLIRACLSTYRMCRSGAFGKVIAMRRPCK